MKFSSALAMSCAILSMTALSANASVTQLTDASQMTTTFVNGFEEAVNLGPVTFTSLAERGLAASWADSNTPSGLYGLTASVDFAPLTATFSVLVNAVGFYAGNDDFDLEFDVVLRAFRGATEVGGVRLAVNRNDFADQFVGLQSSIAFDRVEISYQRPQASGLDLYIDDFRISAVPEPQTVLLVLGGVGIIGWTARRRG